MMIRDKNQMMRISENIRQFRDTDRLTVELDRRNAYVSGLSHNRIMYGQSR